MKEKLLRFGSYVLVATMATIVTLTIVHLENGKYNPSLKLAMDIAAVFETTVEALFRFA